MGQYVQLGICCKAAISKEEVENRVTYEELIEGISKEINLNFYDVIEDEEKYTFLLKKEILTKKNIIQFLKEQYSLYDVDDVYKDSRMKIINELKCLNGYEDIIELAKENKYDNFYYNNYVYKNIYCTKWKYRVITECELIVYFAQGKILMECYYDFLKYIENLIVKSSNNKLNSSVMVVIA